jgi:hypothetical protein
VQQKQRALLASKRRHTIFLERDGRQRRPASEAPRVAFIKA